MSHRRSSLRTLAAVSLALALALPASAGAATRGGGLGSRHRTQVELGVLGTYATGIYDDSAAEIVAHDPGTQRLFVVNGADEAVDVLDAADPSAPALVDVLDVGGAPTSVDVSGGVVAVAVPADPESDPGSVAFFDAASLAPLATVEVGALPDMLTFTPDGGAVVVANEGEPAGDYSVDPEGSVSIVDVSGGAEEVSQADVRTAGFAAFALEDLPEGVRIFGPETATTVAQNLEPEYVAVGADSTTAWVTLQENNALAVVDLAGAEVTEILALGTKDHSVPGAGFDASDDDGAVDIRPHPVQGLYQPDAIAAYEVRGHTYLVTANEGDARDYDAFAEEERVADLVLDPTVFPDAAALQAPEELGRLTVTTTEGDRDGDGDYDALFSFGARSFSIVRDDGRVVFDSGDAFEQITADLLPEDFNSDNEDNDSFDSRSDNKGPEPEGVVLGRIGRRTYAFIGLERVGGIMVYDVTRPRRAQFVDYLNNRDFRGDAEAGTAGDLGPEGLTFIPAQDSPTGAPLLAVANEVSGTTTLFSVTGD